MITILIFGWRILRSLKTFAKAKSEMQALVMEVSDQINQAQIAVKDLKENANSTGKQLEERMDRAQSLSDELEFIYQAAQDVCQRLQGLTDGEQTAPKKKKKAKSKKDESQIKPEDDNISPFAIRDPEFEQDLKDDAEIEEWSGPDNLETQAERELYEALKSKKVHN